MLCGINCVWLQYCYDTITRKIKDLMVHKNITQMMINTRQYLYDHFHVLGPVVSGYGGF